VWEEAIFGCENHGLSIENAVEALKLLNLFEKKDRPPYKLSMGEKIRLSIASVLAMNPKVIILDEPTTGQDDVTLGMLESIITQLSGKGKTVILITHDTDFAFQVSSRVVVINEGHIVADGEPGEILTNEELINRCGIEPPTALIKQEVAGNHGEL
jgi:energy-coupling factor transporter ATP-binding protein EcfA2